MLQHQMRAGHTRAGRACDTARASSRPPFPSLHWPCSSRMQLLSIAVCRAVPVTLGCLITQAPAAVSGSHADGSGLCCCHLQGCCLRWGVGVDLNLSLRGAFQSKPNPLQHVGTVWPSVRGCRFCDAPAAPWRTARSGLRHLLGARTMGKCCGLPWDLSSAVLLACNGGCHC